MKNLLTMMCLLLLSASIMGCSANERIEACKRAQMDVQSQLKAPSSAEFPECSDQDIEEYEPHKFVIESYVDAQNGFGAMIRSEYLCEVSLVEHAERVYCDIY